MKWLLYTILLLCIVVLMLPLMAHAQNVPVNRALQNMGATLEGVIYPPGSNFAVPVDAGMTNLKQEPVGPVIEVDGKAVKQTPQPPGSVGPLYDNSIRGRVAPR